MLKHRWVPVLGLSVLLVCAACASGDDAGSADGAPAVERQFMSVGTAPAGGAFFIVGSAIADVLDSNAGDRGWKVTAETTKGSQENIRRVAAGELELVSSASWASRRSSRWRWPSASWC